jgi:hypothetical protein
MTSFLYTALLHEYNAADGRDVLERIAVVGEALLGEVSAAQVARLVLEIVVQEQVVVRIEIGPALDHQIEDFVGQPVAVLDRRAAGQHRICRREKG